jgi:uncharacterized protein (TIGR02266 family)
MIGQSSTTRPDEGERRPPRVDYRVPVDILGSKGIRLSGKTRNVSEGGMFVETALLLPVGTPVRCGLALEASPVEVFGRIAWSRPRLPGTTAGMGIQFVGFEHEARRLLHEVVQTGDPVPQMVAVPDDTARITRASGPRLLLGALFGCVATATAIIVAMALPEGSQAASAPKVAPSAPASASALEMVERRDGTTAVTIAVAGDVSVRQSPLSGAAGVGIWFDRGRAVVEDGTFRQPEGVLEVVEVTSGGREIRLLTRGPSPGYRVEQREGHLLILFATTDVSR